MFVPKTSKVKTAAARDSTHGPARSHATPVVQQTGRDPITRPRPEAGGRAWNFAAVPVFAPGDARAVRAAAADGTAGAGGPLPHLTEIQRAFGRHDVSHVSAHHGTRAAAAARAIGARAYAAGERVAFAGSPDVRTAAHEAAHVVQQRGGVHVPGGVGAVGDAYERHADAVADRVASGRPADALLDRMAPAASRSGGGQGEVVQREQQGPITTNFGEFTATTYDALGPASGPAGSEWGIDIVLEFDPDKKKVDAKTIGLTQTVRNQLAGATVLLDPSERDKLVTSAKGEGRKIDQNANPTYANPLYATGVSGATDKLGDTATPYPTDWGQHGSNYTDAAGTPHHDIAKLIDKPKMPGRGNNAAHTFETAALAVEGTQNGVYMGSVSWGWTTDAAGKYTKLPLTLVGKGNPSAEFKTAAQQWNKSTTAGTIKTAAKSTNVYDAHHKVAFTVAKDTQVTVGDPYVHNDVMYDEVTIASGTDKGKTGGIKVSDLKDVGGGRATIKLPIKEQPKAGTEAAEVEKALKVKDYSTAYQILDGPWIRPLLSILSQFNKKGLLRDLYANTQQADVLVLPRLRAAMNAVLNKESKVPLSQEFYDWMDPTKNVNTTAIAEIKAYLGMK
jgi:Domain of unknown function (DUF4157)